MAVSGSGWVVVGRWQGGSEWVVVSVTVDEWQTVCKW
jgi:hypothetical protein